MRSLSDTIGRLAALKARTPSRQGRNGSALEPLRDFGSNPGALDAFYYLPASAPGRGAPLVVVLHGCTQDARGYDHGSGWSQLADENGFALLFPQQRRANNMNLCFNWYEPGDSRRDAGEPLSIRQMVGAMIARHRIDAARVYVTGLSAGGAMTSVMLATYPEVFAGGAIIAGLPFGSATNVPQAFDRMRGHGSPDVAALAASVRSASAHRGAWPTVSVWHGTADRIVDESNGDRIVEQWLSVHGLPPEPSKLAMVDGYPHRQWTGPGGAVLVEDYRITGMGHGTPLATRGADGCGASGAHMLEVAISSTRHIARFWGLAEIAGDAQITSEAIGSPGRARQGAQAEAANDRSPRVQASGVGKAIEDALRAAGLMR
jgi:poly(hydroxyalkanoate) depolymerase family esterase